MKKLLLLLFAAAVVVPMGAQAPTEFNLRLDNRMQMNIQVCTDEIFRVRITPHDQYAENLMIRYGVQKADWQRVDCRQRDNGSAVELSTGKYVLTVSKKDGAVRVADKSGRVVLERIFFHPGSDALTAKLGKDINERFASLKVARNDGIIGDDRNRKQAKDTVETGDYRKCSIVSLSMKPGERFYGGGSTSREHIQHRGELLRMWATYQHTEIPQPFLMSSEGWGVFNNTTVKNFFDVGRYQSDALNIFNTVDEADFYLMFGRSMPDVLNAFTLITGRAYLQPKYAYGLCFGPNMYENQFDVLSDAVAFRRDGCPCDLLWLEPQWMEKRYDFSTKKKWNYKLFSPEGYWDSLSYPKKEHFRLFIGRLHGMGFKLGLWLCEEYDLSITEEDEIAAAAGRKTSGKEHWMDHLTKFIDNGVDGFKMDPARTIDEHPTWKYYNGYSDKEMHNLNQVLLPKQMELMMRRHTGRRNWHHYTSGYAGTQHWGASTSGDNGGGKTALFDQLNLGMSGHMNTSCDIMSVDSLAQEMPALHFGVFLPWMQINSWYSLMQPEYFAPKQKRMYIDYIRLRYALLPYIYSTAIEGSQTGMPIVRAMPLEFPDDRNVDDACYQYMFGKNLLVGIFSNSVYLPEGEWTDFWTGEKVMGGTTVTHAYPENRAGLLFVRPGAIIPMQRDMNFVGEYPLDTLIVRVYPDGKSSFTMSDDDGISYDFERGAIARTTFQSSLSDRLLEFEVFPVEGEYKGMYTHRVYQLEACLSRQPRKVFVNGVKTNDFTYEGGVLKVALPQSDIHEKAAVKVAF